MSTRASDRNEGADYYYVKGVRVPLERDPRLFAVRLEPAVKHDSPVLSASTRRMLSEESEPVAFIAEYGLRIMRSISPRSDREQDLSVRRLDADKGVDQAVTAFRRAPGGVEAMFTTRRFVVQFRADIDRSRIDAFNAEHHVRLVEPAAYMPNGFVLEAPSGEGATGPVALASAYYESGLALSSTPDFVRQVHTRRTGTTGHVDGSTRGTDGMSMALDGEFLDHQWHLRVAGVVDAWDVTIGDPSVVVAVLDDGIDVDHHEFTGKVVGQADFAGRLSDARPKSPGDKHGTACAGVAVARGMKAYGAAPGASLLAVRTPEFLGLVDEAEMFRWVCDQGADVISCSWGPADATGSTDPLPDNVRSAIHYCITDGRNGKGIPILWAAGNGNESVSLDGYASNPEVIAVGASTSKDTRSFYSDFGPEVWVCAPSSGATAEGDRRVFTTDRSRELGYNSGSTTAGDADGDYTNDFGGTSSATPLVAGIIALMLSRNAELTHERVRDILRTTAVRIGNPSAYDANGHSIHFGFGRIDARAAVDACTPTDTVPPAAPAGRPTIEAPDRLSRSERAPVFRIGTGANPLYAVEVATGWHLFDGTHDDDRTPDTFHASWEVGPLLTEPRYVVPDDVWDRLRAADRIYYRVHTAQDANWSGWMVSVPDEEAATAPSIVIEAGAADPTDMSRNDLPAVFAPSEVVRSDAAPVFQVSTAGRPWYALEVAARPDLFDSANDADRTPASHWGSWEDFGMLSAATFQLPHSRWNQLRDADRLYYRIHVADDEQWTGWAVSTEDEQAASAPFLAIADGSGSSGTVSGPARTVVYPSTVFEEAGHPDDGIDYSDPVGGGAVPLVEVRDRLDDRLSANFLVRELAARRVDVRGELAAYARLSPVLVQGLQGMREALGKQILVNSCYRYPALNDDVDGAGQSQHVAGRAADIRSPGVEPLTLARLAVEVFGGDIGLGLGRNIIHVDVRGEPASWVYNGASMLEAEFDAWVRRARVELGRSVEVRQDVAERTRPSVVGPSTVTPGSPPPAFAVFPGQFPFYGMELASEWSAFSKPPGEASTDSGVFYASWREGGLHPAGQGQSVTYRVPEAAWNRLAAQPRLFYRVVCGWSRDVEGTVLSVPVDEAETAPSILITGAPISRTSEASTRVDPVAARLADEARWRHESV